MLWGCFNLSFERDGSLLTISCNYGAVYCAVLFVSYAEKSNGGYGRLVCMCIAACELVIVTVFLRASNLNHVA